MPQFKKVLQFDDEERNLLANVASAKHIQAVVKPVSDEMKQLASSIRKLSTLNTSDIDDVKTAQESLNRLRDLLNTMPDSEVKTDINHQISLVESLFSQALSL